MPNKNQELEPVNDIKMVQRYLLYGLEFREVLSCLIEDNEIQFEALILSVDATTLALEIEITEEGFARLD